MNNIRKIAVLISVIAKWLPKTLIFNHLSRRNKPIHILFCMVDHYEPGNGNVSADVARERVDSLLSEYPKLAKKHKDSAGNHPKRTWFFPPHYHTDYFLKDLVSLCETGHGEIEFHLHHGKSEPDTSENLRKTIKQCIEEYSYFGIFGSENGQKKYGFIHGDWALDNSRNGKFCGVNNEIRILNETGCYADFTFPTKSEANPAQINSIYYAEDDPDKPKSHNSGIPVKRFGQAKGDLMIIQGPFYPFVNGSIFKLRIFGDAINGRPPVTKVRIDNWVKTGIHVKGKPDWIIVKTHTHGANDGKAVLGQEMDDIFDYLETKYDDGTNYILHYVTARELYNIIKAVEAGEPGTNPEQYRNYKIQPPKYDSSPNIAAASKKLKALVAKTYKG